MPLNQSSSAFPPSSIAARGDVSCSLGPPMLPGSPRAPQRSFPSFSCRREQPMGAPGAGASLAARRRCHLGAGAAGGAAGALPAPGSRAKGRAGQAEPCAGHTEPPLAAGGGTHGRRDWTQQSRAPGCAGNASSSVAWFALVSDALALAEPKLREKGDLSAASSAAESDLQPLWQALKSRLLCACRIRHCSVGKRREAAYERGVFSSCQQE